MVGVAYGAPTEFHYLGRINDAEIRGEELANALVQDDLYVEMTFARVMDTVGLDATIDELGAKFKTSTYPLWHANAAARRNLNRGIPASLCGNPRFNIHANDIDFQIEADFIGIMCPGLPQTSNHYCDRVGRIMNSGDGLYGGMFVCGMYTAAFFEARPRKVVEAGLSCIPSRSSYAGVINDVLTWSQAEPEDWRVVWRQVEEKWNREDACPEGVDRPFNIDAKLNGAYIAMGLLYGQRDWNQTMDIATRCGQDSDCNPSSALGVLGAMTGYDTLSAEHKKQLDKLSDENFIHTEYSFNDVVKSTEARALENIRRAGGTFDEHDVTIPFQQPTVPKLEACNFGVPTEVLWVNGPSWNWQGRWADQERDEWGNKIPTKESDEAGSEATLQFCGTGLALVGELSESGGRADVYIDGVKCDLIADAYVGPNTFDNDLWRFHEMPNGEHTLRLVIRDDPAPGSPGKRISISRAVASLRK